MSEIAERVQRYLHIESTQIPLVEIAYNELTENMMDPTTGLPYKGGMVMEGCFVDFSQTTANNNNRHYDIEKYLMLLQILKKQIWSKKGVYGELEHPEGYAINDKNISHKLLDVWYDAEQRKVFGRIMIMNTPNGLIAQEIVKSGGQLAISARAAGKEFKNADGSIRAVTELLITFDLVYHPGFSAAVLDFVQLNESQKFFQENILPTKQGFSVKIYETDFEKIEDKFSEYINLNERDNCFYEWVMRDLNENSNKMLTKQEKKATKKSDKEKNKKDVKVLQDNESSDEQKLENNLKFATSKDLKQSQAKENYLLQMEESNKKLRNKLGSSYYDNSAGFVTPLNQKKISKC